MGTPPPFADAPLGDFTAARWDEPSLLDAAVEDTVGVAIRWRFEEVAGGTVPPSAAVMTSRSWASKFFRRVFSLRGGDSDDERWDGR